MSVWPAWKVREHGGTTSWYQVLLAFPDGARVDALAVLRDGRVSIEDVSAQPALSLADLTVLADWIEGPLFASCGVPAERSYEGDAGRRPKERQEPEDRPAASAPKDADQVRGCEPGAVGAGSEAGAADTRCEPVAAGAVRAREAGSAVRAREADSAVCAPQTDGKSENAPGDAGPRRARPVWPRGNAGRRLVAQEYRAAQKQGFDPVLAVMSATGHSRRRSLRLIAQARDAGYLTPRHVRRH
ncbi:hypothetical protein GCM10010260_40110 [Streptomyces filipinensis]|uniref:Uncharacterized protein n=1 Tax=Streptomyces filipinensis TaxID=66887 RepID=A0A918IC20_9ACTN|nr:hypothetical protein GCM10010260_40110 [Streptomyces filipinensis]